MYSRWITDGYSFPVKKSKICECKVFMCKTFSSSRLSLCPLSTSARTSEWPVSQLWVMSPAWSSIESESLPKKHNPKTQHKKTPSQWKKHTMWANQKKMIYFEIYWLFVALCKLGLLLSSCSYLTSLEFSLKRKKGGKWNVWFESALFPVFLCFRSTFKQLIGGLEEANNKLYDSDELKAK